MKHSKQAAKSSRNPRTQSHSAWHSVQQCLQASLSLRVVSSHKVRRHYDTARTSRRAATFRPQYKGANDPWQPECLASERPARQSGSNNTSVGAPGCRTPRLQLNAQFTTCYRCYAMPSSSEKPLMRSCLLLAFIEA